MKLVAVALIAVLAGACEDEKDNPAIAARKAECKQLEAHIFRISPEARAHLGGAEVSEAELSKRIDELVAKVPEEDIAQCASGDQAAITCMLGAPDIAAVRACIPALK